MPARRAKLSERIQSSLWLVPAACVVLSIILALALIELDRRSGASGFELPWTSWTFHGGAESARSVLSTIAGSMITVAGTVYSITIVVLTLASVQFAPRVLGNFMRDTSNQLVLGFFVATFTYCLLVLRSVRGADASADEFVPSTAVAVGVVVALVSLGMLIYFIDHMFRGMQVSTIIARVSHEATQQIDALYPTHPAYTTRPAASEPASPAPAPAPLTLPAPDKWAPVTSARSGYIQFIDYEALLSIATRHDAVVRMEYAVGSFSAAREAAALVYPPERVTPELSAAINDALAVGTNPTMQQDVAFGIRQIVDIALKAISPAVNDPTTAVNCIDHLGVILAALIEREMPEGRWADGRGNLRLVARERDFADLLRLSFDQIRHYGAGDPIIVIRLLDTIARLSVACRHEDRQEALANQVSRIEASARRTIGDEHELAAVQEHIEHAHRALGTGTTPGVPVPSLSGR